MVPAASWRDHFKVGDQILKAFWEEFQQSSPLRASELNLKSAAASVEFVLWCVREGHFSEEEFSHFLSEAFNLPVIRSEFFDSPTDHDFWNRVKDLHPWSASCLPLTEWDGHLLIGAVWPDETFKTSIRHRLVLATPTNLRRCFERFESKTSRPEKRPTIPEAKFDPADPFAALSRELGLSPDDASGDTSSGAADSGDESVEAPEGLVIPEGLSFNQDEISRLVALDTTAPIASEVSTDVASENEPSNVAPLDGGTVVHDFETGEGEVIARKSRDFTESMSQNPAASISPLDALALELESYSASQVVEKPNEPSVAAEIKPLLTLAEPEAPALDLDATQPSIKPNEALASNNPNEALASMNPAPKQAPPPSLVIPFAPLVTPSRPAMVKPPAPVVTPPPPASETANHEPVKRPVPEATVVVAVENPAQDATTAGEVSEAPAKPSRRPLFEPASESQPVQQGSPQGLNITQTGTRGKRLEAPPVTSFFGVGGSAGPSLSKSRNQSDHSGRSVAVSRLNPIHLDQCSSVDEAGAQALLQACNVFETAMILLFKDGELQPWKWNDLFLSVKGERPDAIDLQEPSIFKVVFRTAKPYHGYVVTSTVNQKFFNEFYRGLLPKHATLIPIMIDGRMGGMLLCLTNSKIDYRQSLRLMERLSYDLARVFKSLRPAASKAS